MATMQKITTNLWFNGVAEEAVYFYTSIFKFSRIGKITRYGKEGFEFHHKPEGTVMTIQFFLEGQEFVALNGGDEFQFTPAISFIVACDTQEEIDYYWERLGEGGDPDYQQCGWLADKFGVSWQIVPVVLNEMIADASSDKAQRATRAMLSMKKLNIEALETAYKGTV